MNSVASMSSASDGASLVGEAVHRVIVEAESLRSSGGGSEAAIALYFRWVELNPRDPGRHLVIYNLAAECLRAGQNEEALRWLEHVCALAPRFVHGWLGRASALERLGRLDEAVESWRSAVANGTGEGLPAQPVISALNHIGRVLEMREDLEGAQRALLQSLRLRPDQYDVLQHVVRNRQRQCEWPVWADLHDCGVSAAQLMQATSPMAMLGLADDPAMQLMAARSFAERSYRKLIDLYQAHAQAARPRPPVHQRLRIAYASGDLCMHPVGLLLGGLFETHDRSRFEVFVYCWSPEDESPQRHRLKQAPEHFRRVDQLGDEELADLIRSDEIDILIDLQGVSAGARPGVFARRPAPIQISWLGLIGTSALPWLDYVIADDFCIPEASELFYTEKVLRLPSGFQPGDRGRIVAPVATRASVGLPDDAFVFASFNNSYKHSPSMLDCWAAILGQSPRGLLWLLDDNPRSTRHLLAELATRGVDRSRIVLASRSWHGEYLARLALADLFLDNHPYNAGTTAADALWMGLPLLTLAGRTFIARMAASLLKTAGLTELIAESPHDYVRRAVHLANDHQAYATLRHKVADAREQSPLFEPTRASRDVEQLCERVWQQYLQHGLVRSVDIPAPIQTASAITRQDPAITRQDPAVSGTSAHDASTGGAVSPKAGALRVQVQSTQGANDAGSLIAQHLVAQWQSSNDVDPEIVYRAAEAEQVHTGDRGAILFTSPQTAAQVPTTASRAIMMVTDGITPGLAAPSSNDDRIIVCNSWTRDLLIAEGCHPSRIAVIHTGPMSTEAGGLSDGARRTARRQLGIGDADLVLINLEGAAWRSGTDLLVRALADLHRLGWTSVRLLLYTGQQPGSRPVEHFLQHIAEQSREPLADTLVDAIIALPDRLAAPHRRTLLGIADLYVSPHRGICTDLLALEALLNGRPVVGTAQGALAELLSCGAVHGLPGQAQRVNAADGRRLHYTEPDYHYLLETLINHLQGQAITAPSPTLIRQLEQTRSWHGCARTVAELLRAEPT
jgi:predicted O-linked N-acetylglucosamine transferase (SPINDLY family)